MLYLFNSRFSFPTHHNSCLIGYMLIGALACLGYPLDLRSRNAELLTCPAKPFVLSPVVNQPLIHSTGLRFDDVSATVTIVENVSRKPPLKRKSRVGAEKPLGVEKIVNAKITMYGYPDNNPPGTGIAHPVLHRAAGGTGTFGDPITFATDPRDVPFGTKIYVPYLKKYFISEDTCKEAMLSRADSLWVDLWAGGTAQSSPESVRAVERRFTRLGGSMIILNAQAGHPVDSTPFIHGRNQSAASPYSIK